MNLQFTKKIIFYALILLAGIFAPIYFPAYTFQFAVLWLMILFALTWDILGGQMGTIHWETSCFLAPACTSDRCTDWDVL
ncbi:MAG: hypothetical protein CM1200mP30_25490 [Pseudomonadota bacterium]|nr:MAG: hypothetical protein CM1200mP30_25490 [Pseudomonadota bacterium]